MFSNKVFLQILLQSQMTSRYMTMTLLNTVDRQKTRSGANCSHESAINSYLATIVLISCAMVENSVLAQQTIVHLLYQLNQNFLFSQVPVSFVHKKSISLLNLC